MCGKGSGMKFFSITYCKAERVSTICNHVEGKHLTMFAPQHVAGLASEITKQLPAG